MQNDIEAVRNLPDFGPDSSSDERTNPPPARKEISEDKPKMAQELIDEILREEHKKKISVKDLHDKPMVIPQESQSPKYKPTQESTDASKEDTLSYS